MTSDLMIMIAILLFSLIGVVYLPLEMARRLKDPRLLAKMSGQGLKIVKIYYGIGIVLSGFLVFFCISKILQMIG